MSYQVQVMLVDDSTIIRGLISRALTEDPNVKIVATAGNGLMAIQSAKAYQPQVIILDIEMPEMDGITALPKILEVSPHSKVIMASTLTQSNATISMKALELGAVDYLPKPSSTGDQSGLADFYRDLRSKVKALGAAAQQQQQAQITTSEAVELAPPLVIELDKRPITGKFDAVAIASSTGGPQALQKLFAGLKGQLGHVPIFITQHMPPTFTALLAENLGKIADRPIAEAKDGEAVAPNHVYVAPGDYHMVVVRQGLEVLLKLNQNAPENFCRPAADPMLRSLADIYKDRLLVVVLTGMGQDGMLGAKYVVEKGGFVIAQDKDSCVVYGMPKAVADGKLCKEVLPLQEIAPYLVKTVVR